MITMTRVDHRLLHGQVAFAWVKSTGTDCILVANDAVAKDDLRMSVLRLAKPEGVKLVMKSVEDSIKAIASGVTDKYRLFILTESIEDACRLIEGVNASKQVITEVDLGGIKVEEGKRQISEAVFISDAECERVRELEAAGVHVFVQMLPENTPEDALKLI